MQTLNDNEHGLDGSVYRGDGWIDATFPGPTCDAADPLQVHVHWRMRTARESKCFRFERRVQIVAPDLSDYSERLKNLDSEFELPPAGKSLNWIPANNSHVTAALINDLQTIKAAVAEIDGQAFFDAMVVAEAEESIARERYEAELKERIEASRIETAAKAKAQLEAAQAFTTLLGTPGFPFVAEARRRVSDHRCDGLLAVARAIAGSKRIKERDYGPITIGTLKLDDGGRQYFVSTAVWTGEWHYWWDRRSSPHEIATAEELRAQGLSRFRPVKLDDAIRREPKKVAALATETGIYITNIPHRVKSPLERPSRWDMKTYGLLEAWDSLPREAYFSTPTFADAQAIGRLRYLDQSDNVLAWQGEIHPERERRTQCRFCGKPLAIKGSITRGVGPECWGRLEAALRKRQGKELLEPLSEFAPPPEERVWQGQIEELPAEVARQLPERVQEEIQHFIVASLT